MNGVTYKKLNKVFSDSKDKYVKNVVLYAIGDTAHLTVDEEGEVEISKDDLLELLMKGVVIECEDAYLVPTKFSVTGNYVTVICAADGTAKTFYSSEQE